MRREGTSPWVWLLCAAVAVIEPLTHVWLKFGHFEGAVFSGMHVGDTPFFLHGMNIIEKGFFSPYMPCGGDDYHLYSVPLHWLYGGVGWLGARLHAEPFLFLGVVNGLCVALYLWAAWRFLRTVAPRHCRLAFLLLCTGGGVGGVLYVACRAAGLDASPLFDVAFHRYARYELIEGPFLSPAVVAPRIYYTLPLALGFLGLTRAVRRGASTRLTDHAPALLAFLVLGAVNARLGPIFWCVLVCHLLLLKGERPRARLMVAFMYAAPVAAGMVLTLRLAQWNPEATRSYYDLLARSIWFGSLVSATFWLLPAMVPAAREGFRSLPGWGRAITLAGGGYLLAFALLYGAYQTYYGNWLGRGDAAAAVAVSDWAFIGAGIGLLAACFTRGNDDADTTLGFMLLWLVPLAAVGVSAAGHGWLLRFMPERLLAMMPVPLALLAAAGFHRWRTHFPRLVTGLVGVAVASGACGVAVAALCFQGPLGYDVAKGPFRDMHSELISTEDARLVAGVESGAVLAPAGIPFLGDAVTLLRPGTRAVLGQGSFGYSDRHMAELLAEVDAFFGAEPVDRAALARGWCLDYILCPSRDPVAPKVLAAIDAYPWTRRAMTEGDGALFEVLWEVTDE